MAAKTYTITSSNNVVSITSSDGVLERSAQKNGLVINELDNEYIQILDCGVEIFRQKYSSIADIGGLGAPASQDAARTSLVSLFAPDAAPVTGIIDPVLTASFTRPSDTNAYAANDVINNATSSATNQSISNVAKNNGASGYLTVIVTCGNTSVTPRLRIHFYDAAPTTAKNDNAAWAFDRTNDNTKYLGYIDCDALNGGVSKGVGYLAYKAASASKTLYFELQTIDAFTPASATGYSVRVIPDQNIS